MQSRKPTKAGILYIDDDSENLSSFKALFRREYNIFLATSAKAGLEILAAENIQVLITDQRMPEISGTDLLALAAEKFPKIQRFLITAFSDFDPLVEAINKGRVQGYFSKPIDDQFIRQRIEEGLATYYLERKNSELIQRIQQNEKFLSAILEHIPDAIFVKDAHTRNFYMLNSAAADLLGLSREEIIGKDAETFFPEDEAAFCRRTDQKVLSTRGLLSIEEERLTTPGKGVRYFDTKKVPITDHTGTPVYILKVCRDITDLREHQQREKALQNQLIKTQKMEAIGTLAGGIAHDFNNILTLILGYAELSHAEAVPDSLMADNQCEIITAAKRGRDVVKQILTFTRQTGEKAKPIKLTPIIKEALKLMQASLPKKIEIISRLESDALIMGNPTQIHQVFINLFTNAAFAMQEEGGKLEIRLTDVPLKKSHLLSSNGLPPGDYIRITVSDSGRGIAADIIDSIFEPYFTTKEMGEGSGIGLAIVHGIIAGHGGKIGVKSDLGRGTVFDILLPAIEQSVEDFSRAEERVRCGSESILFIDDEPGITKMNVRALKSLGYRVTGCTDSSRALQIFASNPEEFDLVITDLSMPQLNGIQLSRELVKLKPDIPIILCSGDLTREKTDISDCPFIAATMYKPIKMKELAAAIRNVLTSDIHNAFTEC